MVHRLRSIPIGSLPTSDWEEAIQFLQQWKKPMENITTTTKSIIETGVASTTLSEDTSLLTSRGRSIQEGFDVLDRLADEVVATTTTTTHSAESAGLPFPLPYRGTLASFLYAWHEYVLQKQLETVANLEQPHHKGDHPSTTLSCDSPSVVLSKLDWYLEIGLIVPNPHLANRLQRILHDLEKQQPQNPPSPNHLLFHSNDDSNDDNNDERLKNIDLLVQQGLQQRGIVTAQMDAWTNRIKSLLSSSSADGGMWQSGDWHKASTTVWEELNHFLQSQYIQQDHSRRHECLRQGFALLDHMVNQYETFGAPLPEKATTETRANHRPIGTTTRTRHGESPKSDKNNNDNNKGTTKDSDAAVAATAPVLPQLPLPWKSTIGHLFSVYTRNQQQDWTTRTASKQNDLVTGHVMDTIGSSSSSSSSSHIEDQVPTAMTGGFDDGSRRGDGSFALNAVQIRQKLKYYLQSGLIQSSPKLYQRLFDLALFDRDLELAHDVLETMRTKGDQDLMYHPTAEMYGRMIQHELLQYHDQQHKEQQQHRESSQQGSRVATVPMIQRAESYLTHLLQKWHGKHPGSLYRPTPELYCALIECWATATSDNETTAAAVLNRMHKLYQRQHKQQQESLSTSNHEPMDAVQYQRVLHALCKVPAGGVDVARSILLDDLFSRCSPPKSDSSLVPEPTCDMVSIVISALEREARHREAQVLLESVTRFAADTKNSALWMDLQGLEKEKNYGPPPSSPLPQQPNSQLLLSSATSIATERQSMASRERDDQRLVVSPSSVAVAPHTNKKENIPEIVSYTMSTTTLMDSVSTRGQSTSMVAPAVVSSWDPPFSHAPDKKDDNDAAEELPTPLFDDVPDNEVWVTELFLDRLRSLEVGSLEPQDFFNTEDYFMKIRKRHGNGQGNIEFSREQLEEHFWVLDRLAEEWEYQGPEGLQEYGAQSLSYQTTLGTVLSFWNAYMESMRKSIDETGDTKKSEQEGAIDRHNIVSLEHLRPLAVLDKVNQYFHVGLVAPPNPYAYTQILEGMINLNSHNIYDRAHQIFRSLVENPDARYHPNDAMVHLLIQLCRQRSRRYEQQRVSLLEAIKHFTEKTGDPSFYPDKELMLQATPDDKVFLRALQDIVRALEDSGEAEHVEDLTDHFLELLELPELKSNGIPLLLNIESINDVLERLTELKPAKQGAILAEKLVRRMEAIGFPTLLPNGESYFQVMRAWRKAKDPRCCEKILEHVCQLVEQSSSELSHHLTKDDLPSVSPSSLLCFQWFSCSTSNSHSYFQIFQLIFCRWVFLSLKDVQFCDSGLGRDQSVERGGAGASCFRVDEAYPCETERQHPQHDDAREYEKKRRSSWIEERNGNI